MIIDVHAHVYPEVNGRVGVGPVVGIGYGRANYGGEPIWVLPPLNEKTMHSPEMLAAHMDYAGVDRAVLLQGSFYGGCNDYVADAVRRFPGRFVASAFIDLWADGWQQEFEKLYSDSDFKLLKLECSEAAGFSGVYPDMKLDSPEFEWLWSELEKRGLALVLDLGAVGTKGYQTKAVRKIAEGHPKLKIVIAHMAQPTPRAEADPALWRMWEEQIDLGRLPNVWFDNASVLAYVADEGYPYPTAARYTRMAIDRIGAGKLMWGTDVPGLLLHATYPQLIRLTELHTAFLSPGEQALVLGGNAEKLYSWD